MRDVDGEVDDDFEDSLGDDDFDYEEYVHREFEGKSSLRPVWLFTAWLVLLAIVLPMLWALARLM